MTRTEAPPLPARAWATHVTLVAFVAMRLVAAPLWAAADTPPDSTRGVTPADVRQHPPVPHLFTGRDLMYWGGAAALLTVAVFNDRWLTDEAVANENTFVRRFAHTAQPLGNFVYVLPASGLTYGFGRMIHHPVLARRAARVALTVSIANVVGAVFKEGLGRERPNESPDNSHSFKPFSHHDSFPSGHAATAFAAAVALDRETAGRWVPYVVYPAATAVAWSRVHDDKHWTSDVVGGAALGGWTAWKTETFLAHRALGVPPQGKPGRTSWLLLPAGRGARLVVTRILD
jgi:membrane-associated phospholipid phosphatase